MIKAASLPWLNDVPCAGSPPEACFMPDNAPSHSGKLTKPYLPLTSYESIDLIILKSKFLSNVDSRPRYAAKGYLQTFRSEESANVAFTIRTRT